ncbi:MAG: YkgJ family cysteine cluster protein [Pseudomonadota bacterium]
MAFDCLACGACCAYSESWPVFIGDGDAAGIPDELIDIEHGRMLCHGNRCSALLGDIGGRAHCGVYVNRPLVCREFQSGSEDCIMVRRSFGLPAAQ